MLPARSVVYARNGMVASAHPAASRIGIDVLRDGGNAVDAAIAVSAALGFLEPMSCGIGGDLFAILWDPATQTVHGLNASGRAPQAIQPDRILAAPDGTMPARTPSTWTVPGAVDGWFELHRMFGRLQIAELLAPAIRAAEEGEPVPQRIAAAWARGSACVALPGFASTFLPGGRPPSEGDVFKNPALAQAYRVIAECGRDGFYDGPVAAAIDRSSRQAGGFIRRADLAAHRSEWVRPISTTYRQAVVWELPPNSQGITALEMLNVIEALEIEGWDRDSPDFWHAMVEAKKLAFLDRALCVADQALIVASVTDLLSKAYARDLASRVDMAAASPSGGPADPRSGRADTTVVAAADADGRLIALLQSNYDEFGSGHVVEEYGFPLQNRGVQFDLRQGRANSLAPHKRPFHTLMPALVTRSAEPWIAFGVMGGDMQPQGHVQVLVNVLDFAMGLQEAGDAPRCYHTDSPEPSGWAGRAGGTLYLERQIPEPVWTELRRRGHRVRSAEPHVFGGYQAVARHPVTAVLAGATESRKDGCAIGY